RGNQTFATFDHLGLTGVIGHPFLLGNLLIYAGEESRTGVATYDLSDPANPVLLDVLRSGGAGGYWPELWAGGGRLYIVFPYRLDGNGFRIVDATDPTDLRFVADRPLAGATAQYAQFQDEYGFIGDHKIDMRSLQSVLFFDGANVQRTSDPGRGIDISQFALPLGNLLVTGGIGPNQGMAIWAHQAEPDTRGPSVAYHIPRAGQTGYPVGAPISLIVHETLDSRSVAAGTTLIVRPIGGSAIAGAVTLAFDDIITFTPTQPLASDTTYEVIVPAGGIRDAVGNGAVEHRFTFSTGNTLAGNAPPRVLSVSTSTHPARPGEGVAIVAAASDPESGPLEYRFDFGDGSDATDWSSVDTAMHAYAAAGHYTIVGQVRDNGGSIASGTVRATVVAAITGPRPQHSANIVCDTPRRRVWAIDRDNGRVAELDTDTATRLRDAAVCAGPRSIARAAGGQLWIACEGDDTLRVLDETTLAEIARIPAGYGAAPVAVVASASGDRVYAAFAGPRQIVQYEAATRAELARITLEASPRALALSGDGNTLFATRFVSDLDDARVWRFGTAPLAANGGTTIARFGGALNPDTSATGRGVANHLAGVALAPLDGSVWVAANKANTAKGRLVGANADLGADSTVRNLLVGIDPATSSVRRAIDLDNSDSASAVAFSPDGDYALVALQGNDEIAVLDALTLGTEAGLGSIVGRFAVGAAPQGLCVDPTTRRTFVNNFIGRSVTVLETEALFTRGDLSFARSEVATGTTERLAPQVLTGKRVFYFAGDPRMSSEGYMSCATCHVDGGSDGRTWDFTGRDEGLRNTVDLRGRAGTAHGNVHWSANFDEIQDFEHDIRNAFGGFGFLAPSDYAATIDPLGAPKAGRSAELDALAAFVTSLGADSVPRSPHRASDGALTAAGVRGRAVFESAACGSCHAGTRLTDSTSGTNATLRDVGTLRTTSGRRLGATLSGIDTPTLAGLWSTAPFLHDGSAATLADVFRASGGRVLPAESGAERNGATEASIANNFNTIVNNDDTVRDRAYVIFGGIGSAVDFAAIDGGAGGTGAIELRYSATGTTAVEVIVNSTTHALTLPASGNIPGFRRTRWRTARIDGVAWLAGATNSVTVRVAGGNGLGLDELTVSTPAELASAQPHRSILARAAGDRADLEAYLLQLDGTELGTTEPSDTLFRSGFEALE
ncbi:MAG TPA: Ig-like domain-containing protein, partial [Candidatus Saccharimonadia bacterium]|nr:Ig-like domain-containing protein [Candidatus Saccharimonadia bacterium]